MSSYATADAIEQLKLQDDKGDELDSHHEQHTSVGRDVASALIDQLTEKVSRLKYDSIYQEEKINKQKQELDALFASSSFDAESAGDQDSAKLDGSHDPADTIEQSKLRADNENELDSRFEEHTSGFPLDDLDCHRQNRDESSRLQDAFTSSHEEFNEEFQTMKATMKYMFDMALKQYPKTVLFLSFMVTKIGDQDPAKFDWDYFDKPLDKNEGFFASLVPSWASRVESAEIFFTVCKGNQTRPKASHAATRLDSQTE